MISGQSKYVDCNHRPVYHASMTQSGFRLNLQYTDLPKAATPCMYNRGHIRFQEIAHKRLTSYESMSWKLSVCSSPPNSWVPMSKAYMTQNPATVTLTTRGVTFHRGSKIRRIHAGNTRFTYENRSSSVLLRYLMGIVKCLNRSK